MGEHLDYLTEKTIKYWNDIVKNYNFTALLLNAVDVARKSYQQRKDDFLLSTTAKIPLEFRLPIDFDITYRKNELIRIYKSDLITKIATDYLIHTVATVDAYIEDVYSYLKEHFTDGEKLDKSPWRNDSFRKLVQKIPLNKPKGRISTIDMVLDRYEEFREFRHAILHQRGELTSNQIEKFKKFKERAEKNLKEQGVEGQFVGVENVFCIDGNKIIPDNILILTLRKWSYEFLFYMLACYNETPAISKGK